MRTRLDLTGQTFGYWTVIKRTDNKGRHTMWLCKCKCGTIRPVCTDNLRGGKSVSCGCIMKEKPCTRKHGLHDTRLYATWQNMKERCRNPKNNNYHNYGGRGITVCEEWKNSFQSFYDWAMSNGYSDNLTLDRIDVNGNYCPNNCRWSTKKFQANNTRRNIYITYNKKTQTLAFFYLNFFIL